MSSRAAASEGRLRRKLTEANASAAATRPSLTRIATPYDVRHRPASSGRWTIVAPIPLASRSTTEAKATFENRGTATASPADPTSGRQHGTEHEEADEAAEPDGAGGEMYPVQEERHAARGGLGGMAGEAGTRSTAAAARSAPRREKSSAIERRSRSGRSSQSAAAAAAGEQREAEFEVEPRPPERGDAEERDEAGQREDRPLRRRSRLRRRGRAGPRSATTATAIPKATSSGRRFFPAPRADQRASHDGSQHEQADRDHDCEEREPARSDCVRARCRGRGVRNRELRRGAPGAGPTPKVNVALHRMPVDGDRPPVDEVPALREGADAAARRACPGSMGSGGRVPSPPRGPAGRPPRSSRNAAPPPRRR